MVAQSPSKYARLIVSSADIERASGALYRAGMLGGWEDDASGEFVAAFADSGAARLALALLAEDGIAARLEEDVPLTDPFAAHRAGLLPFSVGGFRIDPRGEPDGGSEGPGTLWVPAHGAFGTGLHASTRGILRWIDGAGLAGRRVLDVGCGSGILAIAASRRGAAAAGFDIDAEAVFEARRNLSRNRASGVRLFAGEIGSIAGKFDAVFANMIWEETGPLVPSIAALLAPGGVAVFSGILDEREEEARRGIASAGLAIHSVEAEEEWRLIVSRNA